MTDLIATRRSLHGVAELLLAGPQHAQSGTIRLAPVRRWLRHASPHPAVSVDRAALLVHDGRTVRSRRPAPIAEAAAAVGLTPCSLDDVYRDTSGIGPDDVLGVSESAADEIAAAFERGLAGLACVPARRARRSCGPSTSTSGHGRRGELRRLAR